MGSPKRGSDFGPLSGKTPAFKKCIASSSCHLRAFGLAFRSFEFKTATFCDCVVEPTKFVLAGPTLY